MTTIYRIRPSNRLSTEPGVYDLAGPDNRFTTLDDAMEAAVDMDRTNPIGSLAEWVVDAVFV